MNWIDAHLGREQSYKGPAPPVSIVILVHNEKINIADCLRSCAWSEDVHVLDCGSSDGTCAIARELGAKVYYNPFSSFCQQRNWAIDHIPCKYPWHFHLDADERFTAELVREILDEIGSDGKKSDKAAYMVPSRMMFLGEWLKHSGGYPVYQVRLFRDGRCRFVLSVTASESIAMGRSLRCSTLTSTMASPRDWWSGSSKHDKYSNLEAEEGIAIRAQGTLLFRQLLSPNRTIRRRSFKALSFFLSGRSIWRFLYDYVWRLGVLDGRPGSTTAL